MPAQVQIIGFWLAMLYPENKDFYREGIHRHMFFVCDNLLTYDKNLRVEFWIADVNKKIFTELITERLREHIARVDIRVVPLLASAPNVSLLTRVVARIKTTKIWDLLRRYKKMLMSSKSFRNIVRHYKYDYDLPENVFLINYIEQHSRADIFYFTFSYGVGAGLTFPKLLVIHDLHTLTHSELFITQAGEHAIKIYNDNLLADIARFLAHDTLLITLTEFVRREQIFKIIPHTNTDNCKTIYTPITVHQKPTHGTRESVYKLLSIPDNAPYIFYPTQIRAQKNMDVIVRALHRLRKNKEADLYIVSTGKRKDLSTLSRLVDELHMAERYIELEGISDAQLYDLYAHARVGVAPSYTEGNFPLQAMESLSMGTPTLIAESPLLEDRLQFIDFPRAALSDFIFAPADDAQLAQMILSILGEDKKVSYEKQKAFFTALQKYTWQDAAKQYLNYMGEQVEKCKVKNAAQKG